MGTGNLNSDVEPMDVRVEKIPRIFALTATEESLEKDEDRI